MASTGLSFAALNEGYIVASSDSISDRDPTIITSDILTTEGRL